MLGGGVGGPRETYQLWRDVWVKNGHFRRDKFMQWPHITLVDSCSLLTLACCWNSYTGWTADDIALNHGQTACRNAILQHQSRPPTQRESNMYSTIGNTAADGTDDDDDDNVLGKPASNVAGWTIACFVFGQLLCFICLSCIFADWVTVLFRNVFVIVAVCIFCCVLLFFITFVSLLLI